MPIVVYLDVMLARRKMSLTELSQRVNISLANLSILKSGKAKAIRFSTLEAICKVLACQPGDILTHMELREYKKLMEFQLLSAEEVKPDLLQEKHKLAVKNCVQRRSLLEPFSNLLHCIGERKKILNCIQSTLKNTSNPQYTRV